jgi:hypothetical protein
MLTVSGPGSEPAHRRLLMAAYPQDAASIRTRGDRPPHTAAAALCAEVSEVQEVSTLLRLCGITVGCCRWEARLAGRADGLRGRLAS